MKKMAESNALLNVLCLEDVLKDAELLNEMLVDAGYLVSMDIAAREKEYLSFLKGRDYDIILADYTLPGFDTHVALKLALELQPEVPFICVSGTLGDDKAVELLKQGATDYVLKNSLGRLVFAVRRALEGVEKQKERKKAEQALLQSEENFRCSISESPLGIRIVSVEGKTIYANKVFLDIYEFHSLEEFTSTSAINRYTPESYAQHQERKEKRKNGHDIIDYETSIVRKNAEIRHVKVSYKEVLWNGIKHYQVINFDITEHKKLIIDVIAANKELVFQREEKEKQTVELIIAKEHAEESDKLKSAFLANMSHEIRTPMNSILGFTELLKEPDLTGEEQKKYVNIIEKSGARLLNIVNNILDISKIQSGQMEVTLSEMNINEKIKYLYTFFKPETEQKGIRIFFKNSLPTKEATIKTDREKVYAILTNLIKNAIKFTTQGSIEFGYEKKDHYLEFFVKDTGVGIRPEKKEIIFERFRQGDESLTRNHEGTGLGLTISKAFVEMLGGKIWINSEEGKGSVFYFTIPYNV